MSTICKEHNPLVSILIVVKNEEKHLPILLRLINKQTYRNIEVVIIDNGSTDRTPYIMEEFRKTSPFNVKVDRVIGTLAQAYNKALDLAEGEYIAIIGGDEYPVQTWIEEHVRCLQGGCDACLAPVIYIPSREGVFNRYVADWYCNRSILEVLFNASNIGRRIVFNTGNVSFKACAIKKVRFYKPMTISEDGEMSYRFIKHGFKLCFESRAMVFHPSPSNLRQHISFWWKLAYANKALTDVHNYVDLKRMLIKNVLLSHLDPREWIKTSKYCTEKLPVMSLLHLAAFIAFAGTITKLYVKREKVLYRYIQREK